MGEMLIKWNGFIKKYDSVNDEYVYTKKINDLDVEISFDGDRMFLNCRKVFRPNIIECSVYIDECDRCTYGDIENAIEQIENAIDKSYESSL